MSDGRAIAMAVDPNTDNDVCTFCPHVARWDTEFFPSPKPICEHGAESYFRSMSQYGAIWVSACGKGEPSADALIDNMKAVEDAMKQMSAKGDSTDGR